VAEPEWFDGPIALSARSPTAVRSARADAWRDFAYIGSAFIATPKQRGRGLQADDHRSTAEDICLFKSVHGVHGKLFEAVDRRGGMDPDNSGVRRIERALAPTHRATAPSRRLEGIWASGQGVGSVGKILPPLN